MTTPQFAIVLYPRRTSAPLCAAGNAVLAQLLADLFGRWPSVN